MLATFLNRGLLDLTSLVCVCSGEWEEWPPPAAPAPPLDDDDDDVPPPAACHNINKLSEPMLVLANIKLLCRHVAIKYESHSLIKGACFRTITYVSYR